MIHIHLDNNHPTTIDIISMKNFTNSTSKNEFSSSIILNNKNEHIYEYLYNDKNDLNNKKIYTIEQILDNVESIQKHYEQIIENPIISSSSCFFTFKQMVKIFKNFKILRNKTTEQINQIENKSPFIFGGETLQWIALPQYNDHIYENELIK